MSAVQPTLLNSLLMSLPTVGRTATAAKAIKSAKQSVFDQVLARFFLVQVLQKVNHLTTPSIEFNHITAPP